MSQGGHICLKCLQFGTTLPFSQSTPNHHVAQRIFAICRRLVTQPMITRAGSQAQTGLPDGMLFDKLPPTYQYHIMVRSVPPPVIEEEKREKIKKNPPFFYAPRQKRSSRVIS
jgi:hypothetical protein